MRRARAGLGAALALAAVPLIASTGSAPGTQGPPETAEQDARVELGRRLFYEADLSINGTMSCATCHEQHHAFADGNATHPGALDDPGRRNVPGLANVGELARLTWADPGQTDLIRQVDVPMLGTHPVEMAMREHTSEIAMRLGSDPCYIAMFEAAFPNEDERREVITYARVAQALAAFEVTLVSKGSPWDQWRAGRREALSPDARAGAGIFARDCASCHAGDNFTDTDYHRIAATLPADPGLQEITGRAQDAGRFRTAPLRNVAVTAPYLHDGSAPDLASAIARHRQVPTYSAQDMDRLTAFLASLTDEGFLTDPRFALPRTACNAPL